MGLSFVLRWAIGRKILVSPLTRVENEVVVSRSGRPVVLDTPGIALVEVVWTTVEEHEDHRLVTVWGNKAMEDIKATIIIDKLHDML